MLKKLVLLAAGLLMMMGVAFGAVDVNKADQAQLDSIKGIGPKIAKSIVDERTKNGSYKDWADLEQRVKGVGEKNASKMSSAGLTVNGQSKSGAPASGSSSASGRSAASSSGESGTNDSGRSSKSKRSSNKSSKSGSTLNNAK